MASSKKFEAATPEEVRDSFERRGISISRWAIQHGVRPGAVHGLLNGTLKAKRGDAHKAAVLLGMKEGLVND